MIHMAERRPFLYEQLPTLRDPKEVEEREPSIESLEDQLDDLSKYITPPENIGDYVENQYRAYSLVLKYIYTKARWSSAGPRTNDNETSFSSTPLMPQAKELQAVTSAALRLLEVITAHENLDDDDKIYEYADACYVFALTYLIEDPDNIAELLFRVYLRWSLQKFVAVQHKTLKLVAKEWFKPQHIIYGEEPRGFAPFTHRLDDNPHPEAYKLCPHCAKAHLG